MWLNALMASVPVPMIQKPGGAQEAIDLRYSGIAVRKSETESCQLSHGWSWPACE
jgi:hypothetical protein